MLKGAKESTPHLQRSSDQKRCTPQESGVEVSKGQSLSLEFHIRRNYPVGVREKDSFSPTNKNGGICLYIHPVARRHSLLLVYLTSRVSLDALLTFPICPSTASTFSTEPLACYPQLPPATSQSAAISHGPSVFREPCPGP